MCLHFNLIGMKVCMGEKLPLQKLPTYIWKLININKSSDFQMLVFIRVARVGVYMCASSFTMADLEKGQGMCILEDTPDDSDVDGWDHTIKNLT